MYLSINVNNFKYVIDLQNIEHESIFFHFVLFYIFEKWDKIDM